jgi:hypothetical protein
MSVRRDSPRQMTVLPDGATPMILQVSIKKATVGQCAASPLGGDCAAKVQIGHRMFLRHDERWEATIRSAAARAEPACLIWLRLVGNRSFLSFFVPKVRR